MTKTPDWMRNAIKTAAQIHVTLPFQRKYRVSKGAILQGSSKSAATNPTISKAAE
jgi:hypothetical protein